MRGGISDPAVRPEYRMGMQARHIHRTHLACPYGIAQMLKRSLWLCGWHDADLGKEISMYRSKS